MGPVWLRRVGNIMVGFNERNTRNRRGKICDQRPSAHAVFLRKETYVVTPAEQPIEEPSCIRGVLHQHISVCEPEAA
jgi:hypothetical protein